MTQDIEPLDYVKRTNIEEHKQFHDKINEIVENLAPTVDRADQLLQQVGEQSTQVADAVTNANNASTQAQAAAATALGLGDRVTAVENSAARNHSDITVLDGEVTDINNDLTNVVRKVTNDVQKINKGLRVGEVPAGDDVVVSRKVLQDLLDAYESMVRTSGNQSVSGVKDFISGIDGGDFFHPCHVDNTSDNIWKDIISFEYKNDRACIFDIVSVFNNTDVQNARIKVRMQGGTVSIVVLRSEGTTEAMAKASNYVVTLVGTRVTIKAFKRRRYTDLAAKLVVWHNYQTVEAPPVISYPDARCADPSTESFDSISIGTIVPYKDVN